MKIYYRELIKCSQCPDSEYYDDISEGRYCTRKGKMNEKNDVPEWCPLPDKE